jgi:hypothetical protein
LSAAGEWNYAGWRPNILRHPDAVWHGSLLLLLLLLDIYGRRWVEY